MTTRRPGTKHLNVAFIKEMLNKGGGESKRCHECQEHFCGINRAVTSSEFYSESLSRGQLEGQPLPPPPKDPVGNA